jgi:acyl-CoA synthetase (AMP-forming)/AMP-acid ligase II
MIQRSAKRSPRAIALVEAGAPSRAFTYSEFGALVDAFARDLIKRGLRKAERVGILARNSIEWAAFYLAVSKAGGISVPLNYTLQVSDLAEEARDCGIAALYSDKSLSKKAHKLAGRVSSIRFVVNCAPEADSHKGVKFPKVKEGDPASIIYTAGTTRKPLGVVLTHKNLLSNSRAVSEYSGLSRRDRTCCVLPFYYIYGLSLLLSNLSAGASVIIDNRFMYPNLIADGIKRYRATGFAGVPSHYAILLYRTALRKKKLPDLRYFMQAGDAMPPRLILTLAKAFPRKKIYLMYGQTEAGPRISYLSPDKVRDKPDSVGSAIPGAKVRVVDESGDDCGLKRAGEILVASSGVMKGYWNNPVETKKAVKGGWLHTGDIAFRDGEGDLFIVGREKNFLKVAGRRISPLEIERIAEDDPSVLEAACVGAKDKLSGQKTKLFVSPVPGKKIDANRMMKACKEKLPPYMVPSKIVIMESLPKSSLGKINRKELESI